MVITLTDVSFKYVEKMLLNNVAISFTDSEKVGIVGVNGCGKSTLLKILCDVERPISGKINKTGNMVIGYLEQEPVFPNNVTIKDCLMNLSTKSHPVNDYEVSSILNKLKLFNHEMITNNLSGGEKKRLALAKVLVVYCDLLILDEPTNHLDNEMIIWLEKYLSKWNKGFVMVTHDRYFLERVCNKMVELEDGHIYSYQANYSRFLELKQERMEALIHQEKKIKSTLRTELEWMRRGALARSTKSKSRIERFEKLSQTSFKKEETLDIKTIKTRLGKKIMTITDGCKSFDGKVLFNNFNFSLLRSDHIGFVGDNGCGKSTLFKIIMGLETLSSGIIEKGETLNIGYFSQHLELIDSEIRVIDYIKSEQEYIETVDGLLSASVVLESFMFSSDLQYAKVKALSGGEKRRLQLVKVLMKNPNFLILDEPTNDLDIYTLEILEGFLESFYGPVLVVSHDRYFMDKVCDKIYAFEGQKIREYNDSFTSYLEIPRIKEKKESISRVKKVSIPAKLKNEIYELESNIPKLEEEIDIIKKEEKNGENGYQFLIELLEKREEKERNLENMMTRYFELLEEKDKYEREIRSC